MKEPDSYKQYYIFIKDNDYYRYIIKRFSFLKKFKITRLKKRNYENTNKLGTDVEKIHPTDRERLSLPNVFRL